MSEQRMKDYRRVIDVLQHCENMLENFQRSFDELERAKVEIFDDPARRSAFVELVQLDTETSLATLQASYQKYKAVSDWLTANK